MKRTTIATLLFCLVLTLLASACSPAQQPAAPTALAESYTDPFAYCAAVGTIAKPDARYTGPAVTDSVIKGFIKAAGLVNSTEPSDVFAKATTWRCMNNKVMACNFGANLPCDSLADTNKTPTQAMNEYCAQNPGSEFIPMFVTGHATVFNWRCEKDQPQAGEQVVQVDEAGYAVNIWYAVEPGQ